MTRHAQDTTRNAFSEKVGAEIRELREAGGLPQQVLADLFD